MNKLAIIAYLIISIILFPSNVCFAQQNFTEDIQALKKNQKINIPDTVLEDFMKGKLTTRVIVNLRDPFAKDPTFDQDSNIRDKSLAVSRPVRNLKELSVRRRLQADVNAMQNRVINAPDMDTMRITTRFKYIFGFSAEIKFQKLQELAKHPDVLSIDEDMLLHANLAQGIPLMNASNISSIYNGSGMAIAICDTGIDYNHPMLGGGGFPNDKVIGGYDTGDDDADPIDEQGHGTACAGIVAGSLGNTGDYIGGVAYNAKLYALKISNTHTSGSANTSDMIEAWEWCVTHQNDDPLNPIMIISTSFGGGRYTNQADCDNDTSAMTAAAANAKAVGITLFVSSGNDGYCDAMGWPGCLSNVISVGAVYDAALGENEIGWCVSENSCAPKIPTDGCSTGYYSPERGAPDQVTVYSNTASFLSLLAPSNWAYTTKLDGGYWDTPYGFGGTSAACPYAAGAAAVLQSTAKARTGAYLTPDQVEVYLTDYGDLITDSKVDITKPRINLENSTDAITSAPLLTTTAVSSITANSASSGGNVTDDGAVDVTARGVCWGVSVAPTTGDSCTTDGMGTDSFTSAITGLIPNAVYHVRAYATNSIGTGYGDDDTFTTPSIPPTVNTGSAASVTESSATLNGTVNPNGTDTDGYFQYGMDQNYALVTTNTGMGSGRVNDPVSADISGLNESTTYHYRLLATNESGTSYGDDNTFTTLAAVEVVNQEVADGSGSSGCFIATAAFGSPVQPSVKILREFRNRFLLNNNIGKSLVNFYYKYSPPMADCISRHDNFQVMVRICLLPVVGMSWMALKFGPASTLGLLLLLALMSASGLIFIRKTHLRRHRN